MTKRLLPLLLLPLCALGACGPDKAAAPGTGQPGAPASVITPAGATEGTKEFLGVSYKLPAGYQQVAQEEKKGQATSSTHLITAAGESLRLEVVTAPGKPSSKDLAALAKDGCEQLKQQVAREVAGEMKALSVPGKGQGCTYQATGQLRAARPGFFQQGFGAVTVTSSLWWVEGKAQQVSVEATKEGGAPSQFSQELLKQLKA